jgi:hypothetical protein
MTTMKTSASTSVSTAPPMLAARAMATTKAMIAQAATSLIAAQVRASVPSGVRERLRSWRMRASTGNAVMLIEMPMNSAKPRKVARGPARSERK